MTLTIISRNMHMFATYATWILEVSQSDYSSFISAYDENFDFPFEINISGSVFVIKKRETEAYKWDNYQLLEQYYITITWLDLNIIPTFDIFEVSHINYDNYVSSIVFQPGVNSALKIMVAYRPIVFEIKLSEKPPVAYCDIYFDDVYYKTLSKTNAEYSDVYRFDISDASQERLTSELAPINGSNINIPTNYFALCYCKFRTSNFDSNGFLNQETPIPIQGTSTSSPINGGGIKSKVFYVVNAVLQHENNQNLKKHLNSFINYSVLTTPAALNTLPLTHRPKKYKICNEDNDYISVATCYNPAQLCVEVKYKNGEIINLCSEIEINTYIDNNPIGSNII